MAIVGLTMAVFALRGIGQLKFMSSDEIYDLIY